eukprot:1142431-Pelagomonas_calceolata.AAC.4
MPALLEDAHDAMQRPLPVQIVMQGKIFRISWRALFIDSYFKAALRAVANGMDVRGFYYWSLMDNFELLPAHASCLGDSIMECSYSKYSDVQQKTEQCSSNDLSMMKDVMMKWATGYTMKFGLYAWEPDGSVDRWAGAAYMPFLMGFPLWYGSP